MIETVWTCDRCGKRLKPSYHLLTESQTKVWDLKNFMFCDECAEIIDKAFLEMMLEFRMKEMTSNGKKLSAHDLVELLGRFR